MDNSLGWIAFGVGIAGAVLGSLAGRQAEAERLAGTCKAALIALLGTIVLFLCTLPSGSPFSPGLGLGSGILVGWGTSGWATAGGATSGVAGPDCPVWGHV